MLKAYRNVPAADEDAVALVLVKLAQLAADLPEMRELDLNPLLADENGRDRGRCARRGRAGRAAGGPGPRAIRASRSGPIRRNGSGTVTLSDGTARPRAAGAAGGRAALRAVLRARDRAAICGCASSRRSRISATPSWRASPRSTMRAPWRSSRSTRRRGEMLGVVRLHANANYDTGEYAVLVRSDLKGRGLGWLLMQTDHRLRQRRRPAGRSRARCCSENTDDAGDVPRARLRDRARSAGCGSVCGEAARAEARGGRVILPAGDQLLSCRPCASGT